MTLWRIRTEVTDRPGKLAALSSAMAGAGGNILALSVHAEANGVLDEFIVDLPPGASSASLTCALAEAGGRRVAAVPASPTELLDDTTRALLLAGRLHRDPRQLPVLLAELLRADDASLVYGTYAASRTGSRRELVVPVGAGRAVKVRREALPFTLTEAARAEAFVRFLLPVDADPLTREFSLADGAPLRGRAVGYGDEAAVRALHHRCSPTTRRGRYFLARRDLTTRMWRAFCDPARGLTLVVEAGAPDGRGHSQDGAPVIALGHLLYTLDPGVAELALMVEDAWQGRGLGTALARWLIELARDRGVAVVHASVLADNIRMRELLTRLGAAMNAGDRLVLEARIPVPVAAGSPAPAGVAASPS